MNCEIICVGTEILLGDILNTNTQYLSQQMAALGFNVLHQCVVGDNAARLAEQLNESLGRSELVLLTGGLGPTADDITKEVCCEVMGAELVLDEEELEKIRRYFEKHGRVMVEENKKQALVPQNGVVFANHHGTAPGCAVEQNGRWAVLLPGPPREMRPMFEGQVKPRAGLVAAPRRQGQLLFCQVPGAGAQAESGQTAIDGVCAEAQRRLQSAHAAGGGQQLWKGGCHQFSPRLLSYSSHMGRYMDTAASCSCRLLEKCSVPEAGSVEQKYRYFLATNDSSG